ncbi:MazG nucleotide pyrophosphohydrolase domain-containing protein [Planctomycetota bacterium]
MQRLLDIAKKLRDPEQGCPWDLQQDLNNFCKYLEEELLELVDAVDRKDPKDISEELGDNLFTLAMAMQLAQEEYGIDFNSIVEAAARKITRRHPHVFGNLKAKTIEDAELFWTQAKAEEKLNDRK